MKSQYKQKFYELYSREILPLFINHENKRKNKKLQLNIIIFIFLCILILSLFSLIFPFFVWNYNNEINMTLATLGLTGSIIGLYGIPKYFNKKFKKELKQLCEPVFAKCFNNLEWDKSESFDKEILERSNLFSYFNRESYDDIFTISHEGVKINVIEADLEDVQGSGKNKKVYNVFKGVIIIFPSNKIIKANTIVSSKGDSHVKNTRIGTGITLVTMLTMFLLGLFFNDIVNTLVFGIGFLISLVIYITAKPKKMEQIRLEDVEFDKRFLVASEDQLEARYLITPAFMDRLKNLQTGFGTKNIKCAFFEDKIMFAISSNDDLFEVGDLFVPLNNSKQMTKFFNELTSILEMVDYFKLDQKIGL